MSPDEATAQSQQLLYTQKALRADGLARDATLRSTNTSLGGDGPTPPTIAGSGVRGWLRAIFEKLPLAGALETALANIFARQADGTQKTQITNFPATQTVAGTVSVNNFPATQPVSGPLTDTQLRAAAVPVSGPLTDTQLRATAVPVSGPLTDAQLRATAVLVSGPLTDTQLRAAPVPVAVTSSATTPSTSAAVTAVASNTSATAVLAANAARKSASYFNDSSQVCYLKSGAGASASSYTVKIPPQGYYEMQLPIYVGAVTAAWAAVDGNLLVTEYT